MNIKKVTFNNIFQLINEAKRYCLFAEYSKQNNDSSGWKSHWNKFKERENLVLNCGNPFFVYLFAKDVDGIDVEKFEQVIINSQSALLCVKFASSVKNADIGKLQQAVIKSGDIECCYHFLIEVIGADTKALEQIISKDNSFCEKLANYKSNVDSERV